MKPFWITLCGALTVAGYCVYLLRQDAEAYRNSGSCSAGMKLVCPQGWCFCAVAPTVKGGER